MKAILELAAHLNTSGPVCSFMHDCIHLIFTPGAKSRCSLTSYGPGAPPLSLQGPYDIMLSGTPRIFFIPLEASLELTPRLNTSWPFFPFMHDSIHLIFTPGAQSRCSLTSYGPGAPPLSLQGPYDVMLSVTPRLNTNRPFFPFMHDCIHLIFMPGGQSRPVWSLLPASTLIGLSSRSCMTASTSFSCLVDNHAVHPAVTSYGPGAPPLSLQGPYDVMLSGTPRIFFIPLGVGDQTKSLQ
ncbi:hypothetical protein BU17DRAFT_69967 [Hysterangium stoloniferum]|nr:hypothetical protein BU17DRAFT_69967 [Hysterangium stoloniferum]